MAANERRLCAVDPYVEQDHVAAQSDGENTAQYKESLRHQSPVNSILILLTKCCPEIESNHGVWTGCSSPNGSPLADWNKAQGIEKYTRIPGCTHCKAIMGSLLLPWHLYAPLRLHITGETRRGRQRICLITHLYPSHYFLTQNPPLTPEEGTNKKQKFGDYAFSPLSIKNTGVHPQ